MKYFKSCFLLLALTALLLAPLLSGCGTTGGSALLTPAAVANEVGQGVQIGLDLYPQARPEVTLARDVICAEVAKTNLSPAAIVADLSTLNLTNQTSKLIIDGGLLVYNTAFNLMSTNAVSKAQPYLDALCQGFSSGLGTSPTARAAPLPPHLR